MNILELKNLQKFVNIASEGSEGTIIHGLNTENNPALAERVRKRNFEFKMAIIPWPLRLELQDYAKRFPQFSKCWALGEI